MMSINKFYMNQVYNIPCYICMKVIHLLFTFESDATFDASGTDVVIDLSMTSSPAVPLVEVLLLCWLGTSLFAVAKSFDRLVDSD